MTEWRGDLPTRWICGEVLDRVAADPVRGEVVARFHSALYADFEGWTVAVTPAAAPRMPNGLSAFAPFGGPGWPQVGDRARLSRGGIRLGRLSIVWDPDRPPLWDAKVPLWGRTGLDRLRARANSLLASCLSETAPFEPAAALRRIRGFRSDDRDAGNGLQSLLKAIRTKDPRDGAHAAQQLVGRGPGLTPVGDDIVAAAALTVASAGAASGFDRAELRTWLSALAPPDLRRRTTSVSATMLELAIRGQGVEPTHPLLDPRPTPAARLAGAVRRIGRLGHTTGPAYGVTIGACALALAEIGQSSNHRTREHLK